jgi:hypothetical protein
MPSLCELNPHTAKIVVLGDLHGSLRALQAALGFWKSLKGAPIVFLGDYADRGSQGVEVSEALIETCREKDVFALKGNHEDYSKAGEALFSPFSLAEEVDRKRGPWRTYFENVLKPFYAGLCLAVLLPGKILFVHGGISSRVSGFDSLKNPSAAVEADILWSDPVEIPGERPNSRGSGVEFGPDISRRVLNELGVVYLMRGHQPDLARSGLHYSHGGRVITLSATDCYGGRPFFLEIDNLPDQLKFTTHFV